MIAVAALLTVIVPAVFAALALLLPGRSATWAREWGRTGALGALLAAVVELVGVLRAGPGNGSGATGSAPAASAISLLGRADLGGVRIDLTLQADQLSALVAVAVGLVALCVQVYSVGYLLPGPGHDPQPHGDHALQVHPVAVAAPVRYPAYAAEVSLFTAAMMLVIHAEDLVLLLIGWEVMGACSYLLVGHHSERASARAAAVKAFLVTRVGDLGVLLAIAVLLVGAGTTSLPRLIEQAPRMPASTMTAAAVLLLAGVAGKSAQFPLHTWLPDAMEGPTPVSALIHAATMVAAGVFLVARLLPVFLAADGVLTLACVIAAITMLGAALAALVQPDLKRLLAWSTISQVAYMLAGVAVARSVVAGSGGGASGGTDSLTMGLGGPGVFHLLTHAAFKALLFLVAGCVTHLVGSTRFADMGGLRLDHPALAGLFGLGLAALAGVPPLGGFWSKEAVLTAAERSAREGGGWAAWLVLGSGLLTTLVTGMYAMRAYGLVAGGPSRRPPGLGGHEHATPSLPASMVWPLWLLAVPTAGLGLVLVHPPALFARTEVDPLTAFTGTILSLAGIGWAWSVTRLGAGVDVADALPERLRAFLASGYRLDDVQHALVVRPYRALARLVAGGDRDVVDAYPRGTVVAVRWAGLGLRRLSTGSATAYVAWVAAGAVLVGLAGVVLA